MESGPRIDCVSSWLQAAGWSLGRAVARAFGRMAIVRAFTPGETIYLQDDPPFRIGDRARRHGPTDPLHPVRARDAGPCRAGWLLVRRTRRFARLPDTGRSHRARAGDDPGVPCRAAATSGGGRTRALRAAGALGARALRTCCWASSSSFDGLARPRIATKLLVLAAVDRTGLGIMPPRFQPEARQLAELVSLSRQTVNRV